jgi:prevent-host-death family protein
MRDHYSLYEAKARLSAIIRQVREGRSVTVTLHGTPVAEIRPIEPAAENLQQRITELIGRGILVPAEDPESTPRPIITRPGTLRQFLEQRD